MPGLKPLAVIFFCQKDRGIVSLGDVLGVGSSQQQQQKIATPLPPMNGACLLPSGHSYAPHGNFAGKSGTCQLCQMLSIKSERSLSSTFQGKTFEFMPKWSKGKKKVLGRGARLNDGGTPLDSLPKNSSLGCIDIFLGGAGFKKCRNSRNLR